MQVHFVSRFRHLQFGLLLFSIIFGLFQTVEAEEAAVEPIPADGFEKIVQPFLKTYCESCHSGVSAEAGLAFEKFTEEMMLLKNRQRFKLTAQLVAQGTMPLPDSKQPSEAEKIQFVKVLDHILNQIDCDRLSDPGRVTIRRLNRAEYNNTVRDLMKVSIRPAEDFPSDDVGYGFDNIGDVLSLPPLLMEKYLAAADKVVQAALLNIDPAAPSVKDFDRDQLQKSSVAKPYQDDGIILVSHGDVTAEYAFPWSGKYLLKVAAAEMAAGDESAKMAFRFDGAPLAQFEVREKESKYGEYLIPIEVERGTHKFSVAFLNDYYNEAIEDQTRRDRNLLIRDVQIVGPLEVAHAGLPLFQQTFIKSVPSESKSVAEAARENLLPFLRRAFRRPVTNEEVERFVQLAEKITARQESFVTAMQVAVTGVLVSPQFLFRVEHDNNPGDADDKHSLTDHELAARLSYFLWSSLPDDELIEHADRGDLGSDQVIEQQVRRMLADPKSQALVENFAEQWLQLRILNEITPDTNIYPKFNTTLREDMKRETIRFFEEVMRQDHSVLDFLTANYTFVNERLGRHYGFKELKGEEFQRVDLTGKSRAGVLTHASILTMTSNPDRTSPVKRGKWIMEVLLNEPPPPPPPNVPELKETARVQPDLTLRQQLELHRQNQLCASCHRVMDQLGFGVENFDAIGRWRDSDGKQALDTRGELPGGGHFSNPLELAEVLRTKQTEFGEGLTEKMLTYALGRGLEFYDRCATDKIVKSLKDHDFKFSVLVTEIAKSQPFRMRRGEVTQSDH